MKTVGKVLTVIFGIYMIICGLYCLFTPAITYLMVGYLIGISMICDAVAGYINWAELKKEGHGDGWILVSAILSTVLGCMVLGSAGLKLGLDVFIAYYIAVWLFFRGIIVIVRSFKMRKVHKDYDTAEVGTRWYVRLLLGILLCIFGVLSILNPLIIASTVGMFMGLGIISAGANLITWATSPQM